MGNTSSSAMLLAETEVILLRELSSGTLRVGLMSPSYKETREGSACHKPYPPEGRKVAFIR